MDSPCCLKQNLRFPFGVAEHFHLHGHAHERHWESDFEIHNHYFRQAKALCQ